MANIRKSGKKTRKGDVLRWMRSIGPTLEGRGITHFKGKAAKVRQTFFSVLSVEFFSRLEMSLEQRADGKPDEFGNTWKPLAESTKIYRPLTGAEKKRHKIGRNQGRGLLTKDQDKEWRRIFAMTYSRLSLFMSDSAAKERAAKKAWHILKMQGARTKKQALRNREARILNNTGRLFNSMRPSKTATIGGYYRPKKEQIASWNGSKITYGTKVPYAAHVNKDRELIPNQYDEWVNDGVQKAIAKIIEDILENVQ